jgi:hypothetical protein
MQQHYYLPSPATLKPYRLLLPQQRCTLFHFPRFVPSGRDGRPSNTAKEQAADNKDVLFQAPQGVMMVRDRRFLENAGGFLDQRKTNRSIKNGALRRRFHKAD